MKRRYELEIYDKTGNIVENTLFNKIDEAYKEMIFLTQGYYDIRFIKLFSYEENHIRHITTTFGKQYDRINHYQLNQFLKEKRIIDYFEYYSDNCKIILAWIK